MQNTPGSQCQYLISDIQILECSFQCLCPCPCLVYVRFHFHASSNTNMNMILTWYCTGRLVLFNLVYGHSLEHLSPGYPYLSSALALVFHVGIGYILALILPYFALNLVVHCWALVQSVITLLCKNFAGAPNYQSWRKWWHPVLPVPTSGVSLLG